MALELEIIELATKLMSYETVSKDSNLALIDYIAVYLNSHGLTPTIQLNENKNKANLIVTIGPKHVPGILLAAHTDVVPTENQRWTNNPFSPWIEGKRLYGRGSADMKGFIAVMLYLAPKFKEANLKSPFHICLTYDEEIGCFGAYEIVKHFKSHSVAIPAACIVGEPTNMRIINAHKGMRILRTIVKGPTGHSSRQIANHNSAEVASKLILFLNKLNKHYKKIFKTNYITINVGQVNAGTAVNIIPEYTELLWEYRIPPGEKEEVIIDMFKDYCKKLENKHISITTTELANVPSLYTNADTDFIKFFLGINDDTQVNQADYCTEAGVYQRFFKVPTLVCGPGCIEQAHKENEYVELSQLEKARQLFMNLIYSMCVASE